MVHMHGVGKSVFFQPQNCEIIALVMYVFAIPASLFSVTYLFTFCWYKPLISAGTNFYSHLLK